MSMQELKPSSPVVYPSGLRPAVNWVWCERPCLGCCYLRLHVTLRMSHVLCMARIRRAVGWAPLASASVLAVLRRCHDLLPAGLKKKIKK